MCMRIPFDLEGKLRMVAEGLGRMVMSRKECWQVVESLGLDEASFDSALDFFHSIGTGSEAEA